LAAASRASPAVNYTQGAVVALAALARWQGEADRAQDLIHELHPQGPATEPGDCYFPHGIAASALAAALALDAGDLRAASDWIAAHERWLDWSGAVLWRAEQLLLRARHAALSGDSATARVRAEDALVCATEPRQPLALLAAQRFLGELDAVAGRHPEAAERLAAALALAEACAAPYERALTHLALADLHLAAGDRDSARAALDEACALLERLEAHPALARADALAARLASAPAPPTPALPFGLTAREAEVLRLLAEGLADPQIAARLFVGRSTVNTHLRAVYGKLGVNTRAAATRLALDHGLR
jgi:DNA-binding CsgD family transcriptional regulator